MFEYKVPPFSTIENEKENRKGEGGRKEKGRRKRKQCKRGVSVGNSGGGTPAEHMAKRCQLPGRLRGSDVTSEDSQTPPRNLLDLSTAVERKVPFEHISEHRSSVPSKT